MHRLSSTVVCACTARLYGQQVAHSDVRAPSSALCDLYFCEECHELRCNDCVAWETSSCYCPHCLFEVPGTSVRTQHARCGRNCFTCPLCTHVLSIVGSDPPRTASLTAPEASQGVEPFYFSCTYCRWDSKRWGLVADKPQSLGATLDAWDAAHWPVREFENVSEHMASVLEMNRWYAQRKTAQPPSMPEHEAYMPTLYQSLAKHAARQAREADELRAASRSTTLAQRWAMPSEQPYAPRALRPQRVRLRSKLSKRCAVCRHILVRPELRTSSGAYKIKLMAHQFLPACTLAASAPSLYTLTLENPLMDPMDVTLRSEAELSAYQVHVPAYVDVLEWDDDTPSYAGWDGFASGVRVHRHQASLSMRLPDPPPAR
ncbi:dynactin p62 [Malassezia pachydermatis]|uniref:Dynactin subunit 4 n=1 Tax=Malassezia pachydermatis TaxID=77020 RepID=A0A0M8MJD8_9BASI|nr:dynactin p62 [Malassezia pachydermatis]KOS12728.1 dynactin p62 [Malassezia pachydermatis]